MLTLPSTCPLLGDNKRPPSGFGAEGSAALANARGGTVAARKTFALFGGRLALGRGGGAPGVVGVAGAESVAFAKFGVGLAGVGFGAEVISEFLSSIEEERVFCVALGEFNGVCVGVCVGVELGDLFKFALRYICVPFLATLCEG